MYVNGSQNNKGHVHCAVVANHQWIKATTAAPSMCSSNWIWLVRFVITHQVLAMVMFQGDKKLPHSGGIRGQHIVHLQGP